MNARQRALAAGACASGGTGSRGQVLLAGGTLCAARTVLPPQRAEVYVPMLS